MPVITITYAMVLIALGIGSYVVTGMESWTALIPTVFGLLFFALGMLARKEIMLKHAMHGAAVLALLALLGTFRGLMGVVGMLGGTEAERPAAAIAQAIMFLLTVVFLGFCVNSFIQARKRRAAGG